MYQIKQFDDKKPYTYMSSFDWKKIIEKSVEEG